MLVPCVSQTAASGGYATGRISLLGGETRYAGQWPEYRGSIDREVKGVEERKGAGEFFSNVRIVFKNSCFFKQCSADRER